MSTLNVDKVDPNTGTTLELGTSGDTITVPTGAGLTVTDEVKTNKISPATGTAFALGDSGDTFTLPSGATIVNSGTATGFGGGKILQCIQTTHKGAISTTSTSYVASGVEVIITPSATTSKILAYISGGVTDSTGNARVYCSMYYKVTSGGTYAIASVHTASPETNQESWYCPSNRGGPHSVMLLHAPATVSELYYSPYYYVSNDTGYFNQESAMGMTITVMEVDFA